MIRTARQIKVGEKYISNGNISAKVGTVENRNNPDTIYIEISFWIQPKDMEENPSLLKKKLHMELKNIYNVDLQDFLSENKIFPKYNDNIYIMNMPESVNYNKKKNFVSLELYIHTLNLVSKTESYPLSKHKESIIFTEAIKVIDIMSKSKILMGESGFNIYKKK
jgi:hypothetical protein